MTGRTGLEKREYEILQEYAQKSAETAGRKVPEEKCDFRTEFQRDRDRIIHSKAFRRLMHKTQVFLSPEGDHFRTRLTHTLEVAQIARTIARALDLNEDLTEAIALGHDLGHTPFGHSGEKVLDEVFKDGFRHNEQSLRVVDVLEKHNGNRGLNLTFEVRDGILNHTGKTKPVTLEGRIVRISDRIAYINHDIDDAISAGVLTADDLPRDSVKVLGDTRSKRIDVLVRDIVEHSDGKDDIIQGEEYAFHMDNLRSFMFENVYYNKRVKDNVDLDKVRQVITELYFYYSQNKDRLPEDLSELAEKDGTETVAKDYVAGMTDRYSITKFKEIKGI